MRKVAQRSYLKTYYSLLWRFSYFLLPISSHSQCKGFGQGSMLKSPGRLSKYPHAQARPIPRTSKPSVKRQEHFGERHSGYSDTLLAERGSASWDVLHKRKACLLSSIAPHWLKHHLHFFIPAPPLSTTLWRSTLTPSTFQLHTFSASFLPKSQTPGLQRGPPWTPPLPTVLPEIALLHPFLTCPVGQWSPERLGMCCTVLEPIRQALEKAFLLVEVIWEVIGQDIQHPKFKRGHSRYLGIPAGQQNFVEGDTIREILWSPIIIQQTGAFHMGYKATYRSQRRGAAQRLLQGVQTPVTSNEWGVAFLASGSIHRPRSWLECLRASSKGIDGSSREIFRCHYLFVWD